VTVAGSPLRTLNRARLDSLRRGGRGIVAVPDESLLDLPERAVQFGTGGFLRGFVDDFLHRANERGLFGGRIVAVGSTGSARDRALREQDGLYTLAVEGIEDGRPVQQFRIIGSVSRALSAHDDWAGVLALARAPLLQFVFSNTTEVGIALHPDDRADDTPPRSFPAKLTRFLFERAREFEYDPSCGVVVVPCELIERNGATLRELTMTLAERWALGTRFMRWIDEAVPFCNTLVDRIVPGAPRGEDASRLAAMLGYEDPLLTTCEPYRLFAIEGAAAVRDALPWTAVDPGIVVDPDIAPYRERKVRLLNGAHTLLVAPALAMGCETVRDAVTHPLLGRFVRQAMFDEIVPSLDAPGAADFAGAVLERFQNPFIRHALVDITLQSTMKMRVRVVPSILAYAARTGGVPQSLAFGFAAFLSFMQGRFQSARGAQGLPVPVDDQADRLAELWTGLPDDPGASIDRLVRAACSDRGLWSTDLAGVPGFSDAVTDHLQRIRTLGVPSALAHLLASPAT
jgi:tagaturonate reductase